MSHTSRFRSLKQGSINPLLARQLAGISATLVGASNRSKRALKVTSRVSDKMQAGQALVDLFTPPPPAASDRADSLVPLAQMLVNYPSSPSVPDDCMIGAHDVLDTPMPQLRGGDNEGGLESVDSLMKELLGFSVATETSHEDKYEKEPEAPQQLDVEKPYDADTVSHQVRLYETPTRRSRRSRRSRKSIEPEYIVGPALARVHRDRENQLKNQRWLESERQKQEDAEGIRLKQEQQRRQFMDRLIDYVSHQEGVLRQVIRERERGDGVEASIDDVNQQEDTPKQEETLKLRMPLDEAKLATIIAAQFEIAGIDWVKIQAMTKYLFSNGPEGHEAIKDKYEFVREAEEELDALAKRVHEEEAEYEARNILPRRIIVWNIAADAELEEVEGLFVEYERDIVDVRIVDRDPHFRTQVAHIDMVTERVAKLASLTMGSIYGLIPKMRVATEKA